MACPIAQGGHKEQQKHSFLITDVVVVVVPHTIDWPPLGINRLHIGWVHDLGQRQVERREAIRDLVEEGRVSNHVFSTAVVRNACY